MSRTQIAFAASDISALAKSLREQLAGRTTPPGHVELLNMLARAAGHRNYQQLRAAALGQPAPTAAEPDTLLAPAPEPVDTRRVEQALRHFDALGLLLRWPARTPLQQLCLEALWAAIPAGRSLDELAINALLRTRHSFGDPALLRRALWAAGLLWRTRDGRDYRRIEREPTPEGRALIARLGVRPRREGATE